MPTKTGLLDQGNFVRSPDFPADDKFVAYLGGMDSLLATWQQTQAAWRESPFASEVLEKRQQLDAVMEEYLGVFGSLYTIRYVEQDPRFLTPTALFARYRPVRRPFAILHCDSRWPLHTVAEFPDDRALKGVNAALREDTPLRWWQDGPAGHPCYLFGDCVWELKPSEFNASEEGLAILFLEASEKDRQRRDRLRSRILTPVAAGDCALIPQAVRTTVYRRDRGKCARCGGREGLDFEFIIPPSKGGASTAENIHLLCTRCASCSQ